MAKKKKAPKPKGKKPLKKKTAPKKKTVIKRPVPKKKAVPEKKPAAGEAAATISSLTGALNDMDVTVAFRLGGGKIIATLMRVNGQNEDKTIETEGTTTYSGVVAGDVLSLNGACSGTASLSTNRTTIPASDPANPLKFQGPIIKNLRVK